MKKKKQQNQMNIINLSYTNSDILNNNDKIVDNESVFEKASRKYLSFFDMCGSCFIPRRKPISLAAEENSFCSDDQSRKNSVKKTINNNNEVYDSGIRTNGTSTTTVTSSTNGAEFIIVEEMYV